METKKVLVLTVDEARAALIDFYKETLQSDDLLEELLKDGSLDKLPVIPKLSAREVANLYAELCLGESLLLKDESLDLVMVQTDVYDYEFAAHKYQGSNVPPPLPTNAAELLRFPSALSQT